ncbi:CocE/NonD family hydrolase [Streptomyces sp. NPDC101062]|uniref:CocE/NonD family hydrolase n=1 Tax=unclassified Streptomyces TaxID=2593676 RepID=UPI0037F58605
MNLNSHITQHLQKLAPPTTRNLAVERDLRVPMRDGAVLLADRWTPATGGDGLPIALIRTPYGRSGTLALGAAKPLVERGFQAAIVSTRATFGSDGPPNPFRCEREDGLDTLDWLIEQPWFGESVVLVGASYVGYTQWAVADAVPPQVKAMIPVVSNSTFSMEFLRKDSFSLETPFTWGVQIERQERRFANVRNALEEREILRALRTLPLNQADAAVLGHHDDYIQNALDHDRDDPFWQAADHADRVPDITVPASLVGGWYDLFLPNQLRDFTTLHKTGRGTRPHRLTIGPWTHWTVEMDGVAAREALEWGMALARGEEPPERAPVRLFVMGEDTWRDFPSWPPPGYAPQRFHLQPGGALATDQPADSPPDSYRYDPADPTPAVGGVRMWTLQKCGRVDNAGLEARPDVLTYTTPPLDKDAEVIGEVSAEIFFRSSLPYADVFVRPCDVDEKGRSTNVCDGLISLTGSHETTHATVRLWPTAYRFRRGHRIRVQVSSGAFPRYDRNPGTGEPRSTATRLHSADQQVFHDPAHPSAIILPLQHVS